MTDTNFDCKRLRNPYESDEEWAIRLHFLRAHKEKFPIYRLLCLSNCYINSEVYGCIYGKGLMTQLALLKKELPPLPKRIPLGCVGGITFYKETAQSQNSDYQKCSQTGETSIEPPLRKKPKRDEFNNEKDVPAVAKSESQMAEAKSRCQSKCPSVCKERQNVFSLFSAGNDMPCEKILCDEKNSAHEMEKKALNSLSSNKITSNGPLSKEKTLSNVDHHKHSVGEQDQTNIPRTWDKRNEEPNFALGGILRYLNSPAKSEDVEKRKSNKTSAEKLGSMTEKPITSMMEQPRACPTHLPISSISPLHKKLYDFVQKYNNLVKEISACPSSVLFQMAVQKVSLDLSYSYVELPPPFKGSHLFRCTMCAAEVKIGTGEGSSKKRAKAEAVDNASMLLRMPYANVSKDDKGILFLKTSLETFEGAWSTHGSSDINDGVSIEQKEHFVSKESNESQLSKLKTRFKDLCSDLSGFMILQSGMLTDQENAKQILSQSASFNNALLEYLYSSSGGNFSCRLVMEHQHVLSEGIGANKVEAKTNAVQDALEKLKKICWKIHIKQAVDSDDSGLSREEVMKDLQENPAIPSHNKGSQLLKKLGWKGGGLGAEGNQGLELPVAVLLSHQITSKEGLGLHSGENLNEFRNKVVKVLEEYAKSQKQDDMAFSSEFTDAERAFIHQTCRKLGLKSTSRGSGSQRYLTVSRKRDANELFQHIQNLGGETSKYLLIPPDGES